MNLTPNFTLEQLTISEIALRNGIDNIPDAATIEHLVLLAQELEVLRTMFGHAIHVQSAFRCEALERILTEKSFATWCAKRSKPVDEDSWKEYFATKGHPKGFSGDIICPGFGSPLKVCQTIRDSGRRFDQVIYEFKAWCHFSIDPMMRMQVLTIDGQGTRHGLGEQQ